MDDGYVSPGQIFGEFIMHRRNRERARVCVLACARRWAKKAFDIIFGFSQSYTFHVLSSLYNIYAWTKSVMRCVCLTLWVWFFFRSQCLKCVLRIRMCITYLYWNCSFQSHDACFWKMFEKPHCFFFQRCGCMAKAVTTMAASANRKIFLPQIHPSIICLMTFTSSATFSISWQTLFKVVGAHFAYTMYCFLRAYVYARITSDFYSLDTLLMLIVNIKMRPSLKVYTNKYSKCKHARTKHIGDNTDTNMHIISFIQRQNRASNIEFQFFFIDKIN